MLWEKKVWMSSAFLCDTSSKCDTIPLHSDFCGPWHPRRWNICGCKLARRSGSPWPVVSWMKFQVWSVLLHSGFGMIQAHTWVIYQQIYVEINTIDTYLFLQHTSLYNYGLPVHMSFYISSHSYHSLDSNVVTSWIDRVKVDATLAG